MAACSQNNATFISSTAAPLASLQIVQLTSSHGHNDFPDGRRGKLPASQNLCCGPLKPDQQRDLVLSIIPAPFAQTKKNLLHFIFLLKTAEGKVKANLAAFTLARHLCDHDLCAAESMNEGMEPQFSLVSQDVRHHGCPCYIPCNYSN